MSMITILMGRPTADPTMQKAKNSDTEYVALDFATSQRGQNGDEAVFVQCYFHKSLGERLIKAGVKKGTCLELYGELELHPFIYQRGKNQGNPDAGAKLNVKDWHFCLSNKPEGEAAGSSGNAAQNPGNAGYSGQGAPNNGGYANAGVPNNGTYANAGGVPNNGAYANAGTPNNGAYGGVPNNGAYTNAGTPNMAAQAAAGMANAAQAGYMAPYNGVPAGAPLNDGFMNVAEYQAGALPYPS